MNPVQLSIFSSKVSSIAVEMGVVLQRSAFSPNIRDRLDYSCAIFNSAAELCAQAAHIPVHLGSMAYAMKSVVDRFDWEEGDTLVLNDPFLGGTHLPDVTLVSPVFFDKSLCGFVANRAHHAHIGAESPGSMPVSSSLYEEGLVIEPQMLAREGQLVADVWQRICSELGDNDETSGDFLAQLSANRKGVERLSKLVSDMGAEAFQQGLDKLNNYSEELARNTYTQIPDGSYKATDFMDDDGQGGKDIPLTLKLEVSGSDIRLDFSGTSDQVAGNINCPISVVAAAVYYVFRCLLPASAPACAGMFRSIEIQAADGSLLNAQRPAAVSAGNVETSSRIVDLVITALSQAIPDKMPADSQGTMNNLAMGHAGDSENPRWNYYETIAGGMGAADGKRGLSAVQSHMTNTFNTPVEVLETSFPLRISAYAIRKGSGGDGRYQGGNGLVREYQFLKPARASLLTERRRYQPKGVFGGMPALEGKNLLNDEVIVSKCEISVEAGDRLRIETPGGGGYGVAE